MTACGQTMHVVAAGDQRFLYVATWWSLGLTSSVIDEERYIMAL